MKQNKNRDKKKSVFFSIGVILFLISVPVSAQEPPPRPITVNVTQNLSFGTFWQGAAGGTITVTPAGARTTTGEVYPLSLAPAFTVAIYEITADPGTLISVVNPPPVTFNGSNGGSLTLTVGATSPACPFITTAIPPAVTTLYLGGTLTVQNPGSNPPGTFSGSFTITFAQE